MRRYRELVRAVETSPYGVDAGGWDENGVGVEMRSRRLAGKAFDDSFAAMTATSLPGGEISYRETRRVTKGGEGVGRQRQIATDETDGGLMPLKVHTRAGDRLDQIDARFPLLAMRLAVIEAGIQFGGCRLLDVFERAVDGDSLTAIGGDLGYKFGARSREAKLRVYVAIDALRAEFATLDMFQERRAALCETRVEERRAELAAGALPLPRWLQPKPRLRLYPLWRKLAA